MNHVSLKSNNNVKHIYGISDQKLSHHLPHLAIFNSLRHVTNESLVLVQMGATVFEMVGIVIQMTMTRICAC